MTASRDAVFTSIRRSLGVRAGDATRLQTVETRMANAQAGIRPARGEGSLEQRIATFVRQAESVSATVVRVQDAGQIPAEVARFLRERNLPPAVRMGEDGRLQPLDWRGANLATATGPSAGADTTAVSHAEGGAAETGTLVLLSGSHNPSTLNFLPDNHVVVVQAGSIEPVYEDVMAGVRTRFGKGKMPRTVNLITGPSRSADIEQKLLLGAHGPRRLHILVVG